jgi:CBS domain-containing protein
MQPQNPSASLPSLEAAIDQRPLIVSSDTSLAEAITIMGKAQSSCVLPGLELSLNYTLMNQARASAVLITEGARLLGIFTEIDALHGIAFSRDLAQVAVAEVMGQPAIALTQSSDDDIITALAILRHHRIHQLPIIDTQGNLIGVITPASIRSVLQLDELLKSRQLSEVHLSPVIQASTTSSALGLAAQMIEHRVDCIVLTETTDEMGIQPVGLVLARDIIQLQALGLDLSQLQAQTIMSKPLLQFTPQESVLAAYWQMQQQQVERFVVADEGGVLLGIVTPLSFLYTLDLSAIRSAAEDIQESIKQFAIAKDNQEQRRATLNRQLLENPAELLEQLECSRLLTMMALRIRESLQLNDILQTAVNEVRQFLQTDRVLIYQFNPDWSGIVVVESVADGWRPALNSSTQDTCFGKNYAQDYKAGRTQVVEDIYTAGLTQCHVDILVLFDVRASLVVPILQGEHLWGLLCAYHCSRPRHWRPFEVELLKQLATHMAIAIQQSELHQQLQNELNERKRAEEQLKISLREKETLLKEIHHRVKNNLQIISSVLRLQSDYVRDEKVLALFRDSQSRIRSMALIHEKLYQSKDLLRVNLDEYLRDLTTHLLRSYTASAYNITLSVHAENISTCAIKN